MPDHSLAPASRHGWPFWCAVAALIMLQYVAFALALYAMYLWPEIDRTCHSPIICYPRDNESEFSPVIPRNPEIDAKWIESIWMKQ